MPTLVVYFLNGEDRKNDLLRRINDFMTHTLHLSYLDRDSWRIVASSNYRTIADTFVDVEAKDICFLIEPGVENEDFLWGYAGENHIQKFRMKLPVSTRH